jgi:hypothetical protein
LCALLYGLRQWEPILRYKPFIAHTDNRALCYLHNIKAPTGLWQRWLLEASSYDFDIRHRPGRENLNADGLSRSSHLPEAHEDIEGMEAELEQRNEFVYRAHRLDMKAERKDVSSRFKKNGKMPKQLLPAIPMNDCYDKVGCIKTLEEHDQEVLERDFVIKAQQEDLTLRTVKTWLESGTIPSKRELKGQSEELQCYRQVAQKLELEQDGMLVMRFSCKKEPYMGKEIYRWCIPQTDKGVMESVWRWSHQHATAGHFGCNATVYRASERFYFPSMKMER